MSSARSRNKHCSSGFCLPYRTRKDLTSTLSCAAPTSSRTNTSTTVHTHTISCAHGGGAFAGSAPPCQALRQRRYQRSGPHTGACQAPRGWHPHIWGRTTWPCDHQRRPYRLWRWHQRSPWWWLVDRVGAHGNTACPGCQLHVVGTIKRALYSRVSPTGKATQTQRAASGTTTRSEPTTCWMIESSPIFHLGNPEIVAQTPAHAPQSGADPVLRITWLARIQVTGGRERLLWSQARLLGSAAMSSSPSAQRSACGLLDAQGAPTS